MCFSYHYSTCKYYKAITKPNLFKFYDYCHFSVILRFHSIQALGVYS